MTRNEFRKQVESFLLIALVAFLIRTVGFGLYKVPSGSMETTLLVGESFFADKLSYWFRVPQRGEIIAFDDPNYEYSSNPAVNMWQRYVWGPSNWTKRLIGIPGDHIKGVIENGHPAVYLNDQKLDEPYINHYPLIRLSNIYPRSYDADKPLNGQPFYRINPDDVIKDLSGKPALIFPRYPSTMG